MQLENKHVLITGASRGLGLAIASRLARAGARLTLVARRPTVLQQACDMIQRSGGQAQAISADVADKDAIYRITGEAAATYGAIDMLIHTASILGPTPLRPLLDTQCEDLAAVLETNVVGPLRLLKAITGSMALRGEGTIVAISSDAADHSYPTWGPYGASKRAFDYLIATLAAEVNTKGVQFISVDPGEMDTDMHAAAMPDADPSTLRSADEVAAQLLRFLAEVPRDQRALRAVVSASGVASGPAPTFIGDSI